MDPSNLSLSLNTTFLLKVCVVIIAESREFQIILNIDYSKIAKPQNAQSEITITTNNEEVEIEYLVSFVCSGTREIISN